MGNTQTIEASKRNPDTKAWVSKPGTTVDTADLDSLQKVFDNRLVVRRGNHGETIIASEPQDSGRLEEIMTSVQGANFEFRTVHP